MDSNFSQSMHFEIKKKTSTVHQNVKIYVDHRWKFYFVNALTMTEDSLLYIIVDIIDKMYKIAQQKTYEF
jgi:hypothetical protein